MIAGPDQQVSMGLHAHPTAHVNRTLDVNWKQTGGLASAPFS